MSQANQPAHPLTMIPGPIEFDDEVLTAMSHPAEAHTSPAFIKTFQETLKLVRNLFISSDPNAQGFVIAGSGTLGWDFVGANLIEAGENALLLNTGYFSDSFADALKVYGANVDEVKAPVGDRPTLEQIEAALKQKTYKIVTITHVDTSTGVLSDVKAIAEVVKRVSPETLVVVDGVCSVAVEEIRFDEWKLDFVLTASQKGVGAPSGLSIFFASAQALEVVKNRKTPVASYFASISFRPTRPASPPTLPPLLSRTSTPCLLLLSSLQPPLRPSRPASPRTWLPLTRLRMPLPSLA